MTADAPARTDLGRLLLRVAGVRDRAAGTDAERRAAMALAEELRATGRQARVETVWVRPFWGLVHAVHAALAIVASVAAVEVPVAAVVALGVVLLSVADDASGRLMLLRRLTPVRATQNVVSPAPDPRPVTLVLTAAVDAPRAGSLERGDALARRMLGDWWPQPVRLLAFCLVALVVLATLRARDIDDTWVGAVQLLPTTLCILLTAGFVDTALARASREPRHAGGAAVALRLADRLDARPPRRLGVEVVLAGAGHAGGALAFKEHLCRRRKELRPASCAVVHLGSCGTGPPRWVTREGPLVPLPLHPQLLRHLAAEAAAEPHLSAGPRASQGSSGALAARRRRLPAVALETAGTGPGTDPEALRGVLDLALGLVRRLDAELRDRA